MFCCFQKEQILDADPRGVQRIADRRMVMYMSAVG